MLLGTVGFLLGNLWILLFALFLMGTQSTFFGPIKYAILPEVLKPNELMSGNALFQSGTSLAILFGMILGGAVIAASSGNLIWISLTVVVIALIGYGSSRYILKQNIPAPELQIDWNFFPYQLANIKICSGFAISLYHFIG